METDLENGITIGTHEQRSEISTYMDHSAGSYFYLDDFNNFYEFFSPHGIKSCYLDDASRIPFIEEHGLQSTYQQLKEFVASMYPMKNSVYEVDSDEYRNVISVLSTF